MSVIAYRFGRVPEELLYSDASDRACRLHAVLTRWSDIKPGVHPSREELADLLRCSVDSLDRAIKDLEDRGFLKVVRRFATGNKAQLPNDYVLEGGAARVRRGEGRKAAATVTSGNGEPAGQGGRTGAQGGGRKAAAPNKEKVVNQKEELPPPPATEPQTEKVTAQTLMREHIDALGFTPATTGQTSAVLKRLLDRQHIPPDTVRSALALMRQKGLTSPSVIASLVDEVQQGQHNGHRNGNGHHPDAAAAERERQLAATKAKLAKTADNPWDRRLAELSAQQATARTTP